MVHLLMTVIAEGYYIYHRPISYSYDDDGTSCGRILYYVDKLIMKI